MGMRRVDAERLECGESSPLCVVRKLKRRGLIPLANWYGTGSGSDLALCRQRLSSPPGRYRSLYRTVLRIRQRYQSSPHSKRSALLNTQLETAVSFSVCSALDFTSPLPTLSRAPRAA